MTDLTGSAQGGGDDEQELPAEDFYYDGPFLVFTESYHLKRGHCCNSDCRHCPYR